MRDDVENAPWWCTGISVRSVWMGEGAVDARGEGKQVKGRRQEISDMAFNCNNQRMLKRREVKIS